MNIFDSKANANARFPRNTTILSSLRLELIGHYDITFDHILILFNSPNIFLTSYENLCGNCWRSVHLATIQCVSLQRHVNKVVNHNNDTSRGNILLAKPTYTDDLPSAPRHFHLIAEQDCHSNDTRCCISW